MKLIATLLTFLVIFPFIQSKKSYAFAVTGDMKCSRLINEKKDVKMIIASVRWFQGYYSGRNYENNNNTSDFIKFKNVELFDYLFKFCIEDPSRSIVEVSELLYEKIKF